MWLQQCGCCGYEWESRYVWPRCPKMSCRHEREFNREKLFLAEFVTGWRVFGVVRTSLPFVQRFDIIRLVVPRSEWHLYRISFLWVGTEQVAEVVVENAIRALPAAEEPESED